MTGIRGALNAIPMVQQLKAAFPKSTLSLLAGSDPVAQIFARFPQVNLVHPISPNIPGILRVLRIFPRPDLFIAPFPSNQLFFTFLAFASGARGRILHSYPAGYLQTLAFLPATRLPAVQGLHDVVQNLYLLRTLGIEPDINQPPIFPIHDSDLAAASKKLKSLGIDPASRPIILHSIAPTSPLNAAKRWSPQHYASLICELNSTCDNPLLLIEGPDELGVADEILFHCSGAKPLALHLNGPLGDTAALLKLASLYIGPDSGLAHLAAAVGTPPVTLFAPTDPEHAAPFAHRDLALQPRTKACSPCCKYPFLSTKNNIHCHIPCCINDIRVQDVLESARRALHPEKSSGL